MYTIIVDEKSEYKKEKLNLNEEEEMLWDYCTEVKKMHVLPLVYDYGLLVFYGDTCDYDSAEVFSTWEYFMSTLKFSFMEKAEKYAESKKKEYTIEYVAWAVQTIRAKDDEEAIKIANENLKRLNRDDEYRKALDWDCCDFHYMYREDNPHKYIIYN